MLVHLVYVSAAVQRMDQPGLTALLNVAQARNAAAGITGALVYCDGTFMQVLEGPPDAVEATYARIGTDRRHHDLTVLLHEPVAERCYPDWAMGFRLTESLPADVTAFRSVMDLTQPGASRAQRLFSTARQIHIEGTAPGWG